MGFHGRGGAPLHHLRLPRGECSRERDSQLARRPLLCRMHRRAAQLLRRLLRVRLKGCAAMEGERCLG